MAKKKTKKKSSSRRRVSGIGNANLQPILGVALGSLGGKLLVEKMAITMPDIKPNIMAAGQIILGFLATKAKNPLISAAGLGLIGNGAIDLGRSFGVVSGVGSNPNLVTFQATPQLNGFDNVLSGTDDGEEMGEMSILAGMSM